MGSSKSTFKTLGLACGAVVLVVGGSIFACIVGVVGVGSQVEPSESPATQGKNRDDSEPSADDPAKASPERGSEGRGGPADEPSTTGTQVAERDSDGKEPLPDYAIIEENTLGSVKRSLILRLQEPVSNDVLRRLGIKLHAHDPDYERTFILYLLPDMIVGGGAWASTHFNPDLEVELMGPTVEQYDRLRQVDEVPSGEALGTWLQKRGYGFSRITIYRKDGKHFKKETFTDGRSTNEQLVDHDSQQGRAFAETDAQLGEHYVITDGGKLEIRDRDGVIAIATPIQED